MTHEPVVLLTGFEPFGGWARNVSGEAVRALDGRRIAGALVRAQELPVAYPRAVEVLASALDLVQPAAVVAFGIHGEVGGAFRIEEVAANELDFRIPDNEGHVRRNEPIEPGAPSERLATLPVDALEAALAARGLPVRRSRDAGRYLCNAVYFALLARAPLAAFVHVPPREPGEDARDVFFAAEAAALVAAEEISARRVVPS